MTRSKDSVPCRQVVRPGPRRRIRSRSGHATGRPDRRSLLTVLFAAVTACAPASDPAAALQGALPGEAWIDPALGAAGTASGAGTIVVWFDTQLISGADA